MPGDLFAMDGSEFTYFESSFGMKTTAQKVVQWNGVSGFSFENVYYDSSMNMLRVQFMGEIDDGRSDEIKDSEIM